ncbi:MAG: phenylalanine--tRNA ligase subunit beta [Alphaproteobacteria bacterium]|nr:phenylalanine--tRNA ligase subunit beta [Alphaproteobacteria bacterium]
MKFTLNWLKDHLETDKSLNDILLALTNIGLEVEGVDNPADRLKEFVVAKVVEAGKHPNADRLNLCQVDDGSGKLLQVVCGGINVRPGMKIAFARVGTTIPVSGQALKAGNIRGMDSLGMICSAQELLLSTEESDGSIMDLDTDAAPGSALAPVLGLDDAVIDVSIGPNRSDCFSVRGIARDLAAYGVGKLKDLKIPQLSAGIDCPIKVTITDHNCSHFAGRMIEGVQNKESPVWMQRRLRAVGQKCISALVDVTNYISLDIGRPLHVFDADKLKGDIIVRAAKAGETLEALDGKVYELEDGMTTISDASGVISLAGVMGGMHSGCTESTTKVFIESAYFDPIRIAKTGQSLRILSEARTRFERGVDPMQVALGADLAAHYILEHCGGTVSQIVVAGSSKNTLLTVTLAHEKLINYSGDNSLSLKEADEILKSLGFKVTALSDKEITVEVPSWRHDISLDVDLIEEILRIRGFDKLPVTSLPLKKPNTDFNRIKALKNTLVSRGLSEVYTWSFIDSETAGKFGVGVELEAPLSQEMAVMRPSILPGHLKAIANNQSKSLYNSAFFEVASRYSLAGQTLIEEPMIAGVRSISIGPRHWLDAPRKVDVFDGKADALALLEAMGVSNYQTDTSAPDYYHPGRKGCLKQGNKTLAYFGEIHPSLIESFGLMGPVVAFEVFLDNLPKELKRKITQVTLSPYQAVTRDFAFILDKKVTADQVIRIIQKIDKNLTQDIQIFDVYEGDKLPKGQKSLAIQVKLQALDKTLSEEDLNTFSANLISAVEKTCGGVLRNA